MTKNMTSANLDWVAPHMKLNPPLAFFNVPARRPSTFSTKFGAIPKRQLPLPPSPAIVRSDINAEIRRKATSLREEFPEIVRGISKPPTSWYDLYDYFDAVDLWYEGAPFLFYVLNHISNENVILNRELEESKHAEIRNWAKLWVDANVKRVLSIPSAQDLISIFDKSEQESIEGLEKHQLILLRNALNVYRKEYEHLLAPVEEVRMQALQQSIQQMHQPDHPYHPHQGIPQGHPIMQPGMPIIPQGAPMAGQPYPMMMDEPRRSQMMPSKFHQNHSLAAASANNVSVQAMQAMQPMLPQPQPSHIPFRKFMENQGQVSFNPQPSTSQGDFRHDTQWERRQRGYSNETGRNGRGRGNSHFNNFNHQNRSNFATNDRRMLANNATPRGSPLGRVSQLSHLNQGPIYVHDSQRQSPPFDGDATPRATGRGMMQNSQRIFSDPSNDRTGFPNDARLWQSDRQRANSKPQEVTNASLPTPPFEGHPQAFFVYNGPKSTSTFWYEGEPRKPYDAQAARTVYVRNFHRDDFETHRLKELFAKFGQVESISYLYDSYPDGGGPAFLA